MAFDPRTGRLMAAEADTDYPEKVAKQNIRTSSIKSVLIVGLLSALFICFLLVILAIG